MLSARVNFSTGTDGRAVSACFDQFRGELYEIVRLALDVRLYAAITQKCISVYVSQPQGRLEGLAECRRACTFVAYRGKARLKKEAGSP